MTAAELIADVCNEHGVSVTRLLSSCRWQNVVDARQAIAFKLRAAGMTFPEIGRHLGRDHSTIVSLVNRRPPPSTSDRQQRRALRVRACRERAAARMEREQWIEDACEEVLS